MSCYKNCLGCGCKLSNKKEDIGYTPKEDSKYCQRCFKLKHYNENTKINQVEEYVNKSINEMKLKEHDELLMVLDALNIEQTLIKSLLNHKKITFIINKIDLLQNAYNWQKIKLKIINLLEKYTNHPFDIILVSATKKIGINNLIDFIEKIDYKNNIYFVGTTNAGKSSLINTLIIKAKSRAERMTISQYKNTTLGFRKIKLFDHKIIDTPGFILDNIYDPEKKHLKKSKPINFVLKSDACFIVDEKITIYIQTDNLSNITFYKKNEFKIKKILNKIKIEKYLENLKNLSFERESILQNKKYSISIGNLVTFSFKNISKISIYSAEHIEPNLNSESII